MQNTFIKKNLINSTQTIANGRQPSTDSTFTHPPLNKANAQSYRTFFKLTFFFHRILDWKTISLIQFEIWRISHAIHKFRAHKNSSLVTPTYNITNLSQLNIPRTERPLFNFDSVYCFLGSFFGLSTHFLPLRRFLLPPSDFAIRALYWVFPRFYWANKLPRPIYANRRFVALRFADWNRKLNKKRMTNNKLIVGRGIKNSSVAFRLVLFMCGV